MEKLIERAGVPVLFCEHPGATICEVQDALDVIGAAFGRADTVAIAAERLDEQFFRLRSGLAGEIMQKFVNYRIRLAIVGDISAHTAASDALRDLVRESNERDHVWFVPTLDDLDALLERRAS
ncbi:DUF4180 domain-containing protein [Actinoplanes sp. NPDC049681]|uniref:DUF4180 domain-containing protein n=1 Tax=Actinoplanes sp. NPDC049681 TaxID=3363905 RepID=UPI0037A176B2